MSADARMEVLEIRILLPGNQPVLVLHNEDTDQVIRLWIGTAEAMTITLAQNRVETPRPLTHQLLINSLEQAGDPLDQVRISAVDDEIFYAELILSSGNRVDSRASDAVALALLADAPIYCAAEVLDQAGVNDEDPEDGDSLWADPQEEPQPASDPVPEAEAEESLHEFREFLETLSPEDFLSPDEKRDGGESGSDEDDQSGTS